MYSSHAYTYAPEKRESISKITISEPKKKPTLSMLSTTTTPNIVSVKVSYQGELRRLPFELNLGLDALRNRIGSIFELGGIAFELSYTDPDGDVVTIGSNEELQLAYDPNSTLRLTVSLSAVSRRMQRETVAQSSEDSLQDSDSEMDVGQYVTDFDDDEDDEDVASLSEEDDNDDEEESESEEVADDECMPNMRSIREDFRNGMAELNAKYSSIDKKDRTSEQKAAYAQAKKDLIQARQARRFECMTFVFINPHIRTHPV